MITVPQSKYDAADGHNQECDMEFEMYEYLQDKQDNLNERHFRRICVHQFSIEEEDTYCKLHNEKIGPFHRPDISHIRRSDIGFCLHHQKDCRSNRCTGM